MQLIFFILIGLASVSFVIAHIGENNGVARTPPQGWNTWNHFHCNINCTEYPTTCISENLIKQMADAMVSSGMSKVGYQYINVDDCWMLKTRNAQGQLQPDPSRFPSGMASLASYVHSKGLKFGLYGDAGTATCGGYAGSEGYEAIDAATLAAWGVDYWKLDGCNLPVSDMQYRYTLWSQELAKQNRSIVFSCSWPAYDPSANLTYVASICNLWREYDDITDNFAAFMNILDYQSTKGLAPYAGPGHWNDPDMLEVGNGGCTDTEYTTLFSMWAILAAPLIAGNDLRNMSSATLAILVAPEVIAVDQDALGVEGVLLSNVSTATGPLQVWARPLSTGAIATAFVNRSAAPANITVSWTSFGIPPSAPLMARDLWKQQTSGPYVGYYTAVAVPSHGTALLSFTVKDK